MRIDLDRRQHRDFRHFAPKTAEALPMLENSSFQVAGYSMRIAISVLFCMRVNFRNGVYARGKEIALQLNSKKKTQFIASTEQNSVPTER